jgi:uncharacterized protein (TIGR02145 family)
MKKIFLIFTLLLVVLSVKGQSPNSFRYQALLRDGSGTPKANVAVTVIIDILQGSVTGASVYTESHSVTTESTGLINLDLGLGTPSNGTFSAINWASGTYFIKITVDGIVMGTSQLLSVPYALYSTKAGNGFSGNYADLTNKPDLSVGAVKKLTVTGETADMEEALFEVKNKAGQTVFAVYSEGVRIYVADGNKKGSKGGFSIGGFSSGKAPVQDYLVVSPDSIKMYLDANPGKGSKGGFSIGGFTSSKSPVQDLLIVNPDSIRAYIDYNTGGKGSKGGFSIGGFSAGKGPGDEYLRVTRDSTRIYINNSPAKGSKGGFSIGGFSGSKGGSSDYMLVSPDSTNFYVRSLSADLSSTFNILSINEDQKQKSLMKANADTIDLKSVLTLENNFNVYGNIGYTGSSVKIVIPTLTTSEPLNVTQTAADGGGTIISNGGAAVITSGLVWGTTPNPTVALTTKSTDGSATGSFSSPITGLTASTTYYVRAYATNIAGTGYGNEFGFTTTSGGATVTDIDGNSYSTVTIGTQTWMASNLKTTKFNNGTAIPNVTADAMWGSLFAPAYAWYNNDAATYQAGAYGALYNFYAVQAGNLCPVGWHVPTDGERQTLSDFLGGDFVSGGKLKEIGLTNWQTPNTGATDEVGFTALPAGLRNYMGQFMSIGTSANWWSSTEMAAQDAFFFTISSGTAEFMKVSMFKQFGLSVRCVQGLMPNVAPTVTTATIGSISYTTATGGGDVVNDGGAAIIERGICWSVNPMPTLADSKTIDGTGTGVFVSNMTGLTMGQTYFVRAYATNSVGTSYGNEVMVTTLVAK